MYLYNLHANLRQSEASSALNPLNNAVIVPSKRQTANEDELKTETASGFRRSGNSFSHSI